MLTIHDARIAAALGALAMAMAGARCGNDDHHIGDPKVLGVLATANEGEADFSRNAIDHITDAEVQAFARMMRDSHTAALANVRAVAMDTHLALDEGSLSRRLKRTVERETRRLADTSAGREYDLRFMCAQIRLHADLLARIDDTLTPSATDTRVKALVSATRPVVAQHLQDARGLVQRVGASPTPADGGTSDGTDGSEMGDGGPRATPENICRSRGGS